MLLFGTVSYHFSQFRNHAAQTVDATVVPGVHLAQVRTQCAGIDGFVGIFLEDKKHKSGIFIFKKICSLKVKIPLIVSYV